MWEFKMRTLHTPAPWSVIKGSPQAGIITAPNRSLGIAEVFGGGETDIANARLIAAAPDLLDALKALMATEDMLRDPKCQVMQSARRAIAKAEGKA